MCTGDPRPFLTPRGVTPAGGDDPFTDIGVERGYRPVMLTALLLIGCDPYVLQKANQSSGGRADTAGESMDSADTADTAGDGNDTAEALGLAEWTILVFVNGDNDLERYALGDVNEMEAVGSDERVNVVVQLDRSERQSEGDGDWSGARRYLVTADDDPRTIGSPVLEDLGETDSGSAQTVLDFVDWGVSGWPAQRYALVLWDHGDGWSVAGNSEVASTKGISYDDGAGTGLSVASGDLTEVVEGAAARMGQPIDLLGLDACVMQQWEVAWSVGASAKTMVASEDYEGLEGWPYDDVLGDLAAKPTMSAPELGASVALRFHEIPDSTMSVLDLGQLPTLTARLNEVADAVIAGGMVAETLHAAASGAQGYDGQFSREHDLIDLLQRIDAVSEDADVKAATSAAIEAAEATILTSYNKGGVVKNSHGLSIFSPVEPTMPPLYAKAAWSVESRWDDLIQAAADASKE